MTQKGARRGAPLCAPPGEGAAGTSERSFRYAVYVYAAAELVAIALALYYRLAR